MTRIKKYTSDNPGYEAVKAYREANKIVRVPLDMPSNEAVELRKYCADHGLTVAGFIRGLIRDAIGGDPVQAVSTTNPEGDIGASHPAG